MRGFEIAKGWEERNVNLPRRATKHSAAYDIEAAEDTVVPVFTPGIKPTMIPTGLKAYCGTVLFGDQPEFGRGQRAGISEWDWNY